MIQEGGGRALSLAQCEYGTGEWRLYNVVQDPGESEDLAEEMPEKLNLLVAAWEVYAKDVGVILPE